LQGQFPPGPKILDAMLVRCQSPVDLVAIAQTGMVPRNHRGQDAVKRMRVSCGFSRPGT